MKSLLVALGLALSVGCGDSSTGDKQQEACAHVCGCFEGIGLGDGSDAGPGDCVGECLAASASGTTEGDGTSEACLDCIIGASCTELASDACDPDCGT